MDGKKPLTVDFSNIISASFNQTKAILFKPFALKKWIILAFVAWMAGVLSGGGLQIPDFGGLSEKINQKAGIEQEKEQKDANEPADESASENSYVVMNGKEMPTCPLPAMPIKAISSWGKVAIGLFIFLFILFILLIILFSWLQSRFSFVFLEDIVKNDASVKGPFAMYRNEGNSLFLFHLIYGVGVLLAFTIMLLPIIIAAATNSAAGIVGAAIFSGAITFLILLPAILLIYVFDQDFLVPIMAKDHLKVLDGWRKVIRLLKANKKNIVIYILLKIALAICAGIAFFLIFFAAVLALLLVGGIIGGILYGISQLLPVIARGPIFILAILLFVLALIFALFCAVLIGLPVAVFFRIFSLKVLGFLSPEHDYFPVKVINSQEQQEGSS
ncbi:MAG: hypothetical protein GY858_03380 [Candidatus Omnitrophica bacterium]|nr:hypothetical protein [Candidatus Omnitrophota bacterium]